MEKVTNFFGTDGIRGRVGTSPMVADFILKLGWAVGIALKEANQGDKVLIGKDTRLSGYLVESALQAGLASAGSSVFLLGPMPTPGIAYLTRALHAQIGIVISASHNAFEDNGIKFFSKEGQKVPKVFEDIINRNLQKSMTTAAPSMLGKAFRVKHAQGRYIEFCKSSVPHLTYYNDLKIVLDCANGATYHIAPDVFSELGATVFSIHDKPDGININVDCGSLHPESLVKAVLEQKADVGIAFDGDGDRLIMVDHKGEILDGDDLLYIIVKASINAKRFTGGIVGTQMSNLGLELALQNLGLAFIRTKVGDQYVMRELIEKDWQLGGEPSGHIINLKVNSTGDGIIAALQVLQAMWDAKKSLHDLKKDLHKFPQKITNIEYKRDSPINLEDPKIQMAVREAEKFLDKKGRVVLRASGTEPVIRLMVEADEIKTVNQISERLEQVIKSVITS